MSNSRPLAIAHRGDPYRHRENTLPSLRSAVLAGADAVEIDVRTTRDGVPVLLHDRTLERLWEVERPIAETESKHARGLGVPTLREALAAIGARAMIDVMDAESARAAVAEVHGSGAADRVYYCGGVTPMTAVRRSDPEAEIALTWKRAGIPPRHLMDQVRPRWINMPFGLVDRRLVSRIHAAGLLAGVWTVDTGLNMRRMLGMGVDAITTNRIETLHRLLPGRHRKARRSS
ncbi:glycerophosphodiester phosphodiesterase [Wenjunlia tyrosinilytica]|uniref:Glycerophosphoryl diester phosphodiesterase n=1 Tax=Wenjunlia tyrosinilytica TaxID=1544741 RepID=A0A918DU87_9ACTN|nr:glycerophosphodiester phosphodiesterase [Wenjunlia tyrosinilytica]GGO84141.1 glycerophosphoryl diester phosphodiesterase [Wenjunlia tyrosinilytica]